MIGAAYFICASVPADMHGHGTVERLQRNVFDAAALGWAAGIVDQDVQPPEAPLHRRHALARIGFVRDIGFHEHAAAGPATSSPRLRRRPLKATFAPSSINRSTMRRPMPLVPPVTRATLSWSFLTIVSLPLLSQ